MKHVNISAFDCPDAWFKTLNNLELKGTSSKLATAQRKPKPKNSTHNGNHPPRKPPLVSDKAPCDMKYVQWYALDLFVVRRRGKQDETYTYGSGLREPVDQVEASYQTLRERAARQASHNGRQVPRRHPQDSNPETKERHEPPCLSLIDTEILDGQMHLTCYFRSWDAYGGLPANIAGLQLFNEAFVARNQRTRQPELENGQTDFPQQKLPHLQTPIQLGAGTPRAQR